MPVQNVGGRLRDGYNKGNQGGQSAAARPSSSAGSARHNGHPQAREHPASYQPKRQAEQYER